MVWKLLIKLVGFWRGNLLLSWTRKAKVVIREQLTEGGGSVTEGMVSSLTGFDSTDQEYRLLFVCSKANES